MLVQIVKLIGWIFMLIIGVYYGFVAETKWDKTCCMIIKVSASISIVLNVISLLLMITA